jgi:hypothetical protein
MPQVIGTEILIAIKPILAKSQHPPGSAASTAAQEPARKRTPLPPPLGALPPLPAPSPPHSRTGKAVLSHLWVARRPSDAGHPHIQLGQAPNAAGQGRSPTGRTERSRVDAADFEARVFRLHANAADGIVKAQRG